MIRKIVGDSGEMCDMDLSAHAHLGKDYLNK